jgi:hypothetical protein
MDAEHAEEPTEEKVGMDSLFAHADLTFGSLTDEILLRIRSLGGKGQTSTRKV